MTKKVLIIAITASVWLTSCSSPATKVETAKENVADANKELNKANADVQNDIENYKKEMIDKIMLNEQQIAEVKKKNETEKKEKIAKLEKRNADLRLKMENYKGEGKDNWENFKAEFKHDMEELGQAFKDIGVNNVK